MFKINFFFFAKIISEDAEKNKIRQPVPVHSMPVHLFIPMKGLEAAAMFFSLIFFN